MAIEPFAPKDFRGRRVDAAEVARWGGPDYARAARETFGALRDCFRLQ